MKGTYAMPPMKQVATSAKPTASTKPSAQNGQWLSAPKRERPVIYPGKGHAPGTVLVNGVPIPVSAQRITVAQMKKILGWETEGEYRQRITKGEYTAERRAELEALATKGFGSAYSLKDVNGEKVRLWNNDSNRPFDESHAMKLAQSILQKQFAGPSAMPEETINGEAIIVSCTGRVESGQHRGIALILASQIWAGKGKHKYEKIWPTEPTIDSIVVYGISESERIIRTLDNVKPRALSDVVYTSTIFGALDDIGRKECSRLLERAVNLLWKRTQAGRMGDSTVYQTHSESIEFIERHPKLKECIKHIFEEDKDRGLSGKLKLSPGESAGILYLQGSCTSDVDAYRNFDPRPDEEVLDWKKWARAKKFWSDLIMEGNELTKAVRVALAALYDEEGTGRRAEKYAILAKAWNLYLDGDHIISKDDLALEYKEGKDGNLVLVDTMNFGGIDLGEKPVEEDRATANAKAPTAEPAKNGKKGGKKTSA